MKLGSLFDGSGGFPLAGSLCGIEPVWASEVEPYPIAVTKERFPGMKHLGNICLVNGAEIEPVDIITFGSPCQDLSVAGKRAGLKHEANGDEETTRSGLFMEAVRIIKEMREATDGIYPRFALWENVPGAFSSNKGEDFRIVLEEIIKIVEPGAVMPEVPKKGWAYADSYIGDGWSLAYRTFDAQYWGVPQRRRRIHLVADFRGGCAGKILFEREGVRGDLAESGAEREGTAEDAESGAGAADREGKGKRCITAYSFDSLSSNSMKSKNPHNGIDRADTAGCNEKGWKEGTGYTLNTIDRHAVAYCIGNGQVCQLYMQGKCVALNCMYGQQAVCYCQGGFADYVEGEVGTLRANGGDFGAGSENIVVQEPYYIVRRLTPTECGRLQGFPDGWGNFSEKEDFTDEEYRFWLDVRKTHAEINGKTVREWTRKQMLSWYNKLHTDSSEYKMWGNGIALPPAVYCMQGIADELK